MRSLQDTEFELKLAVNIYRSITEGITVTDASGTILSVNPAFSEITSYTAEEIIGCNCRILKSNRHDPSFYSAMWREIVTNGQWKGQIWNRRKDGEVYLIRTSIAMIRDSIDEPIRDSVDEPIRYVSIFNDVTDSWRKDEQIRHLAFHDALTDLPNRSLLMERLGRQIVMAERDQRKLALMFLDLDRFKLVNDNLGHDVGDELLMTVARKLQALIRQVDTVARFGGDEFTILLDNPASTEEVAHIAERIVATINEPMQFNGRIARVGISIGIAIYPGDGHTPADLLKNADSAMYVAKNGGSNAYCFFEHALPPQAMGSCAVR